jgi:hypothetical protein
MKTTPTNRPLRSRCAGDTSPHEDTRFAPVSAGTPR